MRSAEALTVIGAGPAGLTAAILGCRAGRKVTVYERRKDVCACSSGRWASLRRCP
ncbi:MAG TPA: FAD-dependent oxidoreductase, partial [Thermoanaerobaculia bacterium]|nr:FAD-dependent oxidoreductase [Thermoanaerobaculia bacterium]